MYDDEVRNEPLMREFLKSYDRAGDTGKLLKSKNYSEDVIVSDDGTVTTVGKLVLGKHVVIGRKIEPPKYDNPKRD